MLSCGITIEWIAMIWYTLCAAVHSAPALNFVYGVFAIASITVQCQISGNERVTVLIVLWIEKCGWQVWTDYDWNYCSKPKWKNILLHSFGHFYHSQFASIQHLQMGCKSITDSTATLSYRSCCPLGLIKLFINFYRILFTNCCDTMHFHPVMSAVTRSMKSLTKVCSSALSFCFGRCRTKWAHWSRCAAIKVKTSKFNYPAALPFTISIG